MPTEPTAWRRVPARPVLAACLALVAVAGCRNAGAAEARELRGACDAGDAQACVAYGDRLFDGEQVLQDLGAAARVFEVACDAGGAPESCVRLAMMHLDRTEGVRPDRQRAAGLLRRGCDGGDLPGCVVLAETFLTTVEARPVLEAACEGRNATGCLRLGELVSGLGGDANRARAAELYLRACSEEALGCILLADAHLAGAGVPIDSTAAFDRVTQACETSPEGCFRLAGFYEAGVGVEADPDRAVSLYERACFGQTEGSARGPSIGEACFRMGDLLATGEKVDRDLNRASRSFSRACRLDYEDACRR